MVENLTSRKAQVCDSRGPAMYNKKPDGNMRYNNFILYFPIIRWAQERSERDPRRSLRENRGYVNRIGHM